MVESRLEPQIFRVLLLRRLSSLNPARAAVPLTIVATTGQLVGGQEWGGIEGSLWRAQQPHLPRGRERVSVDVRVGDLDLLPPGRIDEED